MNKDTILSLIRHAMTFGGGFLVAKGAISETVLAQVIPAVVALVGALWGATDEYRAWKKGKAATPSAS